MIAKQLWSAKLVGWVFGSAVALACVAPSAALSWLVGGQGTGTGTRVAPIRCLTEAMYSCGGGGSCGHFGFCVCQGFNMAGTCVFVANTCTQVGCFQPQQSTRCSLFPNCYY
jgi:hypothetical protein